MTWCMGHHTAYYNMGYTWITAWLQGLQGFTNPGLDQLRSVKRALPTSPIVSHACH